MSSDRFPLKPQRKNTPRWKIPPWLHCSGHQEPQAHRLPKPQSPPLPSSMPSSRLSSTASLKKLVPGCSSQLGLCGSASMFHPSSSSSTFITFTGDGSVLVFLSVFLLAGVEVEGAYVGKAEPGEPPHVLRVDILVLGQCRGLREGLRIPKPCHLWPFV